MNKRRTLLAGGVAATMLMATRQAWAAWPDRPVRFVVPFAAGGAADVMGRLVATHLSEHLGVPVVVENKPGASTLIGGEYVVRSRPDGYMLLLGTSSMALLVLRKQGSTIDMRKDLAPVMAFAESVYGIMASSSTPFKTLADLIAYAKANPDKVTYGIPGTGTTPHLVGEYLNSASGIKTMAVPYKSGNPMVVGLMGGEIMVGIDTVGASNALIHEGKIRLLATTGAQRSSLFPDVPTVSETLPGFVARGLTGVMATPGTPPDIVDKLNQAMAAVVAKPDVRKGLAALSLNPVTTTPAQYRKFIAGEVDMWAGVMRESGLVIE